MRLRLRELADWPLVTREEGSVTRALFLQAAADPLAAAARERTSVDREQRVHAHVQNQPRREQM